MVEKEIIQKSRILIVDDQAANVLLLERILQQGGYTNFSKTTDPRQVLEFFTLLTQLRSRVPDNHYLPILVLTADVAPKAKLRALSLGAKDFLTKPFDATEVQLRVYNLLETRWLSVELQQNINALENPCR